METIEDSPIISPVEELQFQQLGQLHFWQERHQKLISLPEDASKVVSEIPARWELTRGVTLHPWQEQCVDAWLSSNGRGVIKVVTGAGKTILALAIAERLQHIRAPQLRVAIVVPTIVLLDQWEAEFAERSNLPAEAVGRLGGGLLDPTTEHAEGVVWTGPLCGISYTFSAPNARKPPSHNLDEVRIEVNGTIVQLSSQAGITPYPPTSGPLESFLAALRRQLPAGGRFRVNEHCRAFTSDSQQFIGIVSLQNWFRPISPSD